MQHYPLDESVCTLDAGQEKVEQIFALQKYDQIWSTGRIPGLSYERERAISGRCGCGSPGTGVAVRKYRAFAQMYCPVCGKYKNLSGNDGSGAGKSDAGDCRFFSALGRTASGGLSVYRRPGIWRSIIRRQKRSFCILQNMSGRMVCWSRWQKNGIW